MGTKKFVLAVLDMPSLLTLDEQIIRQNCLCYLMERLDYRKLEQEQGLGS